MTIKQAIEKAIEGGFLMHGVKWSGVTKEIWDGKMRTLDNLGSERDEFALSDVLLDPSFWQALGKSMGWKEDVSDKRYDAKECSHDMFGEAETQSVQPFIRPPKKPGEKFSDSPEGICEVCEWQIQSGLQKWLYEQHALIDHLAEGGTPESYFKEL